jgi:uncharacterized membrane protein
MRLTGLKDAGFAAATSAYNELRQLHSNHQARVVLRAIEQQRGPTPPRSIRLCNDYARDALGSARYAPWLHVYAAISGTFKDGWIPDNYYGLVVDPLKGGEAANVVILKSFTNRILHTEALPDLAYVLDGIYYSRAFEPIREAELAAVLFDRHERVFFKADNSYQGRSVSIMTRSDFPEGGRPGLPDGVFQAPIQQHGFFADLSPKSVATLRITTARELDGAVTVRAAYLRLGRATDDVVQCRSHVRVSVDTGTGALQDVGYLHDWRSTGQHPDTGFRFSGHSIPHFQDATRLCASLHATCPHMLCLGWDVCIDRENDVKIMEWNARYNDIKFSEATMGPCFRGLGWEDLWKRTGHRSARAA